MNMPGPATISLSQSLRFRQPVRIGDTIDVTLEVTGKQDRRKVITIDCKALNQHDELVATGTAEVIAPTEKLLLDPPAVPRVEIGP